jgi:acyl carrier protein
MNLTVKQLETIFKDVFNIDKITMNDHLKEDLMLDSISLVELQVNIEDGFDIRFNPIEDDMVSVFKTISSLVAFIEGATNE